MSTVLDAPIYEHDCDRCTFIGSFPSRNDPPAVYDVYLACESSSFRWIVRLGCAGDYYTTNDLGFYVLAAVTEAPTMSREHIRRSN